jgi:hypothetical protein
MFAIVCVIGGFVVKRPAVVIGSFLLLLIAVALGRHPRLVMAASVGSLAVPGFFKGLFLGLSGKPEGLRGGAWMRCSLAPLASLLRARDERYSSATTSDKLVVSFVLIAIVGGMLLLLHRAGAL